MLQEQESAVKIIHNIKENLMQKIMQDFSRRRLIHTSTRSLLQLGPPDGICLVPKLAFCVASELQAAMEEQSAQILRVAKEMRTAKAKVELSKQAMVSKPSQKSPTSSRSKQKSPTSSRPSQKSLTPSRHSQKSPTFTRPKQKSPSSPRSL